MAGKAKKSSNNKVDEVLAELCFKNLCLQILSQSLVAHSSGRNLDLLGAEPCCCAGGPGWETWAHGGPTTAATRKPALPSLWDEPYRAMHVLESWSSCPRGSGMGSKAARAQQQMATRRRGWAGRQGLASLPTASSFTMFTAFGYIKNDAFPGPPAPRCL